MDREIPVVNRLVDRKMQQFRTRKHRQTLSQIKSKSNNCFNTTLYQETPKINRYSSSFLENKNLQIQRQNIKLFNKIASIIREKPKISSHNSSYASTYEEAIVRHKKRSDRIKTQNQFLQKRISSQKPTIKNKQFFKDRMKNVKYLKLIGRYPYDHKKPSPQDPFSNNENHKTYRSITETHLPSDIEVYRKKTDIFFVRITRISNNYYVFNVEVDGSEKVYQCMMNKGIYEEQFMRCGYNYDQMISRLRLNDKEEVVFKYLPAQSQEKSKEKQKQQSDSKSKSKSKSNSNQKKKSRSKQKRKLVEIQNGLQ